MVDLMDYGFDPGMARPMENAIPARVTAVHKERYEIVCEQGATFAKLKSGVYYGEGAESFPTTGDFVLINYNGMGDSQIVKTLPRKSYFGRREPGPIPREQAVASNFDYVFVMQSLNHDFNPRRMERYVTLAWQSGATPVVILTKADLAVDYTEHLAAASNVASGVDIAVVSAKTRYGFDSLSNYLKPLTTLVFLGSSGVGKSSLVNALAGSDLMETKEIREDDARGRHTTTHRQLVMLDSGVMIIDTPGMRELGMWDVSEGLGEAFSDVEAFIGKCRFSDCKHRSEPSCAVKAAIASGELPKKRWESYLKLLKEARYSDNKADFMRLRAERSKSVAKHIRQTHKKGT